MRLQPILFAALLVVLSGCAGSPRLSALHDPIYRAETHTSTITARANEPRDGIAQIRVDAVIGELTACTGGGFVLPSLIPCRSGAVNVAVICAFPNVKTEVSCALPIRLGARRIVSYEASARSARGRSASTGSVTYAAGAPLTQTTVNLGIASITMAWETARPAVWRTGTPISSDDRGGRIDFGFVPDADMPTYRAFTDDLQAVAVPLFYTDTNAFSSWSRTFKNLFNLWAGPTGADGEGCSRTFAAPASNVRAAFDGTVILHRNAFRDCASITLGGGAGTTQTTLVDATYVLQHEAGHFLYGLGDEYVGGGNASVSIPKNVLDSKAACESTSTANALPASQCVQIGTSGTWRNDDGQDTIMEDRASTSDWRTLSGKALGNHAARCFGGNCY